MIKTGDRKETKNKIGVYVRHAFGEVKIMTHS